MRRAISLVTIAALFCAPCFARKLKADEPDPITVSGKVQDQSGKAVGGAQIYLIDRENRLRLSGRTNKEGHFSIEHDRVDFESLQVVPPAKSGLAEAILKDIPADEGRHMVVRLKKGVHVIGRVMSSGRPLKGVTVRAIAKSGDPIHDSGEAVTNGKGQYELFLVPGEKVIEVSDVRDDSVVGLYREKKTILVPVSLPDINVPAAQTAGTQ